MRERHGYEPQPEPFSVKLQNPQFMFDHMLNISNGLVPYDTDNYGDHDNHMVDEPVSLTLLDNTLFQSESTVVRVIKEENKTYFYPMSRILTAQAAKDADHHGFYSDERLAKLNEALIAEGTTPEDTTFQTGGFPTDSRIELPISDTERMRVILGYKSREKFQDAARFTDIIVKKVMPGRHGKLISSNLEGAEGRPYTNDWILSLLDTTTVNDDDNSWPQLTDVASFTQSMQNYAQRYEKLLKALYAEQGLPLPKPVVFKTLS